MFEEMQSLYYLFQESQAYTPAITVFRYAYNIIVSFTFLWGPWLMWQTLKPTLIELRKQQALKKMEFRVIEIRIPKNIDKSPLAMELVLQAMHQPFKRPREWDQITKGKYNSWFSLEMVSAEGAVRFFMYVPKDFVKLVSTHLYSQYPDVEVREVDDYTSRVPYGRDTEEWDLHGVEFALTKPDPYPIKTYVDYGLDKLDLKEEYKIDPMTVVLEFLGSIGREQHAWLQIMIQATGDRFAAPEKPEDWWKVWKDKPTQDWKKEADKLIKELKEKGFDKLSAAQKKSIDAMDRSVAKYGFDTGIRALYIAKKEHFDKTNLAGLTNILKQFSSLELNGFKDAKATKIDPKKDKTGEELKKMKSKFFDAYSKREYFYSGGTPFVLNTEELATIYHFPGKVSATPTFSRIESRKAEPPSNLPV